MGPLDCPSTVRTCQYGRRAPLGLPSSMRTCHWEAALPTWQPKCQEAIGCEVMGKGPDIQDAERSNLPLVIHLPTSPQVLLLLSKTFFQKHTYYQPLRMPGHGKASRGKGNGAPTSSTSESRKRKAEEQAEKNKEQEAMRG